MDPKEADQASQVTTQWLAAVSMDVTGLNRDSTPHIALSPHWNGLSTLGQKPGTNFVPIYYVWWTSGRNDAERFGGVARVELFLPTKKLLQLSVDDPKYILRKPLSLTNLASLFPEPGESPFCQGTTVPLIPLVVVGLSSHNVHGTG